VAAYGGGSGDYLRVQSCLVVKHSRILEHATTGHAPCTTPYSAPTSAVIELNDHILLDSSQNEICY